MEPPDASDLKTRTTETMPNLAQLPKRPIFWLHVVIIVSALFLAVLIPILIITFFKEPYRPAIPFALWLLPACAIKGYLQAVDGYLKGRDKPLVGVWARFLSIFLMLGFVALVYSGMIQGPEQKLLCIPMAACLGQAISMVIISIAVIQDTIERNSDFDQKQNAGDANGRR